MKKIFTFITAVLFSTMAMAQTYTYTADLSQLEAGMSIVGDGTFVVPPILSIIRLGLPH